MRALLKRLTDTRGQSVIEFAMVTPLLVLIVLGVVEVSYALLDQHVVTKLSREGSNLISRDTSLADSAAALKSMSGRPVDFNSNAQADLLGGAPRRDHRHQQLQQGRALRSATSTARCRRPACSRRRGSASYGAGPDYEAANPDGDTNIQVTNLPAGITLTTGGTLYITEIYVQHELITPFDKFGVNVPKTLYSIAYF